MPSIWTDEQARHVLAILARYPHPRGQAQVVDTIRRATAEVAAYVGEPDLTVNKLGKRLDKITGVSSVRAHFGGQPAPLPESCLVEPGLDDDPPTQPSFRSPMAASVTEPSPPPSPLRPPPPQPLPPPPPPPEPSSEQIFEEARATAQLREQLRREKATQRHYHDALEQAEQRADVALELGAHRAALRSVIPTRPKRKHRNRGLPVVLLSDWHVEEQVHPNTVDGRNEYTPAIAEARARSLFDGVIWMVQQWQAGWDINELVLWLGGDIITGYIHEELVEGNALSPTEATLFASKLIVEGIKRCLEVPGIERVHVPCSFGNHGRTTQKRRVATGAKNSFEWLMYHNIAAVFADDPRVEFDIADGAHLYRELYGQRVRFHHGDDVRYQGGVGGLSIPLRKACDAWDTFREVDITCIGHWHQFVDFGFAVVNGSLIGYGPFALSVKARYEPPRQAMFLIDEEYGKRLVSPIYCDGRRAEDVAA